MSKILHGIDVSKHNGIIDWDKVKASGIDFAMLRAGYGRDTIDARFGANISECNRLEIPVGVYWFSYATTITEAIKEAEFCIKTISKYKIQYPVVYDLEYDTVNYAKGAGVTIDRTLASEFAAAFLTKVKDAGYTPMLYANPDYLSRMFKDSLFTQYDLWLAHYTTKPYCESSMWQYSDKGQVDGVPGNVDMNYCYKEYVKTDPVITPVPLNRLSVDAATVIQLSGLTNLSDWIMYLESIPSADFISWIDELIVKIYHNRKRDKADWLTVIKRVTDKYDPWVLAISQTVKEGKGMGAFIPQLIEKVNDAE